MSSRLASGQTATWTLVRTFLRRDRWMIFWWTVSTALLYYAQAPSVAGLYTNQAQFDRAAASMAHNAAFIAMAGPARALNTIGGQVAWQASAFGAITLGLMSMFLVGRHTRAEEESGRDELVRAGAVGRYAPLTAAMLVALVANLVAGVLISGSLLAYGLAAAGSVVLGVGAVAVGMLFAATALVAAQLTQGTRAMYGVAGVVIAVAYALRAIGDVGNGVLSWLSPIGWYQAMHPFSGERWWPVLLLVAGATVATVAAYTIFDRRDIGAGVLPDRPGPRHASGALAHPLGLAWRLQRGSVIGWSAGLFLGGLGYGSIGSDVRTLIGDSGLSRDLFTAGRGSLVDAFYATAAMMLALIAGGFAVSSALRPHGEEAAGRVESLLATGLPRRRWLLGHLAVTVAGTLGAVVLGGLGMGVGYALVTGDGSAVLHLTGAALAYSPAVLLLAALARLLYGVVPRWSVLAWLGVAFCAVVLFFGALLNLPAWLLDLSPFTHLARVPAESFDATAALAVLLVAAALSALGVLAFTRRDLR